MLKRLYNWISFEHYYQFKKLFSKYFWIIIVPAFIMTIIISVIYYIIAISFRMGFELALCYIAFIIILCFNIIIGCLKGESRQDEFYADK